jgi:hypothetical protein
MNQLQKRPWGWLLWFIAGLLSALVFAGLSAIGQPANATTNHNQVEIPTLQLDLPSTQPAPLQSAFVDIVATHQQPNFYD